MENNTLSFDNICIATHAGLERQGPGCLETTEKALGFIGDLGNILRVADLGCGTGGQTLVLARMIKGDIVGVDLSPEFIEVFNDNAQKHGLHQRVAGVVGSMEDLSFLREEFDLIWSEGAIDAIGFEEGIASWKHFLKDDGYIAVTCPSWLTDEQPEEVAKFWGDAGSKLDTIEHNIEALQRAGYRFVAAFALPETCWTDHYFVPRTEAEEALLKQNAGNKIAEEYIQISKCEMELHAKHGKHYGYVFYIGKKL